MNTYELGKVEDEYHNDTSRHQLLFATNYAADKPILTTHDPFIDSDVDGLEGHTGSPGQRNLIPTALYGSVILADQSELSAVGTLKSTTMHELGHGLGVGWPNDKGPGHIAECYSGDFCVGQFGVGGGDDETPETVDLAPKTRILGPPISGVLCRQLAAPSTFALLGWCPRSLE
jgi:hypothetical protein